MGPRRHGLHCLVHKGRNLLLGLLEVKSESQRSMGTFQMVPVTRGFLAIAQYRRWSSIFDAWIHMAYSYDGSKAQLRKIREHYPSYIVVF